MTTGATRPLPALVAGVLFISGAWSRFFIPLQRYFAQFGWPPI